MAEKIEVNQSYLKEIVSFLTKNPTRNFYNVESLNICADFLENQFKSHNLETQRQTYQVQDNDYHNVIARYGCGNRVLVVGAHYDVCGTQPGADDNASAVAGLMEIARFLSQYKPNLNYSVELVAYTLEEPPIFATKKMGSAIHAISLKKSKIKTMGMICLEMIGYFDETKGSQYYPLPFMNRLYPNHGNFIAVVGNFPSYFMASSIQKEMQSVSQLEVRKLCAPAGFSKIDFSDHRNYWKRGIKAVMITDTADFRNPHYHMNSDTMDTLDFAKMVEVVKGAYRAVITR